MSDAVIDTPDAETTAPDQTNYLSMSDAEIMAAGAPSEEVPVDQTIDIADAEDAEDAEEEGTAPGAETEDDADEDDEAADEGADSATPADAQSDEVKAETTDTEADQTPEVKVDYEAEYLSLIQH